MKMGFEVRSGTSTAPISGGLVEEGYHAARLVTVDLSESTLYFNSDGTPKTSFVWDVEVYNGDGENAMVRIWTGMSLHPKSHLTPLSSSIFGDERPPGNTDDYLGKVFRLLVDVVEIDGEDGKIDVNRATKPYVFKPWAKDDPFGGEYVAQVAVSDDTDDIPF